MTGEAVAGPLTGKRLKWIPTEVTTWKRWQKLHPKTTVLAPPRPLVTYGRANRAYERYRKTQRTIFPIGPNEIDTKRFAKKAPVTIVRDGPGGKPRAYPHELLKDGETRDGDLLLKKQGEAVRAFRGGEEVPTLAAYWFAFQAFYPNGTVYEPPAEDGAAGDDDEKR